MNIWLNFVPGSAASSIEMILRSTTDLGCMPLDGLWGTATDAVNAHGINRQHHPTHSAELYSWHDAATHDANVFTPILPMSDLDGPEVLDYVDAQPGYKFYLGPRDKNSAEFAVITKQKVPGQLAREILNPHQEIWEQRELLSYSLLSWWLPAAQKQWDHAQSLDMFCIDTLDIFTNYRHAVLSIIQHIGCSVVKQEKFDSMINRWQHGQEKIWQDWNNYVQYKQGTQITRITGDIIQEAMVMYHLREQGINLNCYGLNTFPNSEELKQYYE